MPFSTCSMVTVSQVVVATPFTTFQPARLRPAIRYGGKSGWATIFDHWSWSSEPLQISVFDEPPKVAVSDASTPVTKAGLLPLFQRLPAFGGAVEYVWLGPSSHAAPATAARRVMALVMHLRMGCLLSTSLTEEGAKLAASRRWSAREADEHMWVGSLEHRIGWLKRPMNKEARNDLPGSRQARLERSRSATPHGPLGAGTIFVRTRLSRATDR